MNAVRLFNEQNLVLYFERVTRGQRLLEARQKPLTYRPSLRGKISVISSKVTVSILSHDSSLG